LHSNGGGGQTPIPIEKRDLCFFRAQAMTQKKRSVWETPLWASQLETRCAASPGKCVS